MWIILKFVLKNLADKIAINLLNVKRILVTKFPKLKNKINV